MAESKEPHSKRGRAYTGETIVMPRPDRGRPARVPQPPSEPPPQPPVRRVRRGAARPRWRRRIRMALLGLVALVLLVCGVFYWQVASVAQSIVVPEVRPNPPIATPLLGGANVLLIGVDERPDNPEEGVRSDTLILAHLDATGRWVSLLSIPRDTQVELLDIGQTKINVAYSQGHARAAELYGPDTSPQQGGMALAAQTVEQFLGFNERGMRVHHTAQINFDGFAGVIDALGGVTIDVPTLIIDEEYPTPDFGVMRVEFQPGAQVMDGQTALIYARTRHADSDFGRAERQQQVLRAIVDAMRSKSVAERVALVPSLLRSVEGTEGSSPVVTTMPIARPDVLLGMLVLAGGLDPANISQVQISPETVAVSEVGSNLIWDAAGVRTQVDTWLTRPSEAAEEATVQVFNGTEVNGLAGRVTGELAQSRFQVIVADTAPPGDYPVTVVYNLNDKPLTSQRLARTLDAELRDGPPEGIVSSADIVVVLGADAAQAQ